MSWSCGQIVRCGGELPGALQNARGSVSAREGLWLKLADAQGHLGVGECAPLPGYSRESLEACRVALSRWLETRDDALPAAARCAVEGAELDLRGQQLGKPAHALLSSLPPPAIPLSALVASVEDAERAVAAGFRTLKLKLGIGPFAEALSLLRALRRAVGWDVALRLDANGALPEASVRDQLGALAELRPEFLEEPTTHWSAALSDSPVPLALDESLLRGIDSAATRLAKVAVLKPMLLGGPKRCLALAEQLIAAGLDVTVSHTWDGPVGLATAATTALAIAGRWPGRVRACGLSRHPGLAAWPERELPYLGTTVLQPNALPGLGVTGGAAA